MKVWNYIIIITGLMLLLHMAGLPSGGSGLFNLIGIDFNTDMTIANVTTSASGFFNELFGGDSESINGILTTLLAALGGLAIGVFTKAKPENLILLPLITTTLVLYTGTLIGVMSYAISLGNNWVTSILVLIILPLTIGFILSLAEFFRGTD